jgi:hypothetical protein
VKISAFGATVPRHRTGGLRFAKSALRANLDIAPYERLYVVNIRIEKHLVQGFLRLRQAFWCQAWTGFKQYGVIEES